MKKKKEEEGEKLARAEAGLPLVKVSLPGTARMIEEGRADPDSRSPWIRPSIAEEDG